MKASPGPWEWLWKKENPDDRAKWGIYASGLLDSKGERVVDSERFTDEYGIELASEADANLIRLAPDMAAMLSELEWIAPEAVLVCPMCGVLKELGHRPESSCRLAALLKELP